VQETVDYVLLAFDLAFKYRTPVMIQSDGILGQMMEKVELFPQKARVEPDYDWATTGRKEGKRASVITSLPLQAEDMEKANLKLQAKYRLIEQDEVRYETFHCEDAEYLITAFGSCARIARKTMEMAREKGIKVGLLRPQTLYPFPEKAFNDLASQVKGILCVEMNAGQMIEDVRLAVNGKTPVEHFGRLGGMIPNPEEILIAFEQKFIGR
jgi:2-oxoglutarate/2-oxoacid ferredoxin oxidoreductase subunit alpha